MYSTDGSAHANLTFDVTSKVRKQLLIRKGNVNNLPSYDAGKVYFGTIGVNEGALVGFVDVEYKVKLMSPQSAITSNVINPITVIGALPTWRYEVNASGIGDVNSATSCLELMHTGLLSGGTITGAPLVSIQSFNFPALDKTYRGCTFKNGAVTNALRMHHPVNGRYRMRLDLKIGYEDLKMFAVTLIHPGDGTQAKRKIYASIDGSTTLDIPVDVYTHRGFTGTAVSDPNPGTEVWPVYTFDYDITSGYSAPAIAIGVVPYNSVSTTTANCRGYTGLGTSVVTVEYLGALIT